MNQRAKLVLVGLVSGLLILLALTLFFSRNQITSWAQSINLVNLTGQLTDTKQTIENQNSLITNLEKRLIELEQRLTQLEQATQSAQPQLSTQQTTTQVINTSSKVKEYLIYLGSGSTTNREWTDMTATSTYLNPANYNGIKTVTFEAALWIIGGEVHARLVDQTTGAIYDISEISHNNQVATWRFSPALNLASGNHEYRVQLRSTSGEWAYLDNSRLRITLK